MGAVLACLASATHSLKASQDDKKKKTTTQIPTQTNLTNQTKQPQTLASSQQHEAQQGLADEHLATVSPITVEGTAIATGEATRSVATEAPVPLPVATATDTGSGKMASDEDYASFLEKANQDPSEGVSKTQGSGGKIEFKATEKGVEVPKSIVDVVGGDGAWYTSDADEKFEAVALKYTGKGLPTEENFAQAISHPSPKHAEVDIMDIGEWDTQGEYKDVVDAVREAGKGSDVRVYKVKKDGTRSEYWVVTVEGGKLVGAKVLAVES